MSQPGGVSSSTAFGSVQTLNWLDEAHPRWGRQLAILSLLTQTLILSRNTLTGAFRTMFDPMLWHHVAQSTWRMKPATAGRRHAGVRERALQAERAADAKALGWALAPASAGMTWAVTWGPMLDSLPCSCLLEIHNTFWTRVFGFSFCTRPCKLWIMKAAPVSHSPFQPFSSIQFSGF